jgi:DNA-binding NarL/FixJ family response regulator
VAAERQKPEPVRVLVVDDSEVFRNVLRAVVAATPGFEVVGAAASGHDALELVDRVAPELVLMDVRMQGLDGTETADLIGRRHPAVCVVLLTGTEQQSANSRAAAIMDKRDLSPRWLADFWQQRALRT